MSTLPRRGATIALLVILALLLSSGARALDPTPSRLPPEAPPYPGIYVQYDNPADNLTPAHGYPVVGAHTRYGWDILEPYYDGNYRFNEIILPWVQEHAARGKMVGIAFSTYAGRQYGGVTVPAWLWQRDWSVLLHNEGWYLLNYFNRTYVSEYIEFIRAFAAWCAATPVVREHLAWVEIGTGLFGENQPAAKTYHDMVDHTYYATLAPGGSLSSGWSAGDWVAHVNEIVAAYRHAFDDAGLPGIPVLTNIAPTFREAWERDVIADEAARIGAGLKHAGLLADHNNAEASYRAMRKWGTHATADVPVTWETYGHPWGTSYVQWYWMVWCALAKHPDVFMITRDQVTDAGFLPSSQIAARYLGVTLETTPDVWVALRETFRTDQWDRPEYGNFSFWLYQVDDAMGHTVVETGRNDALTQGDTNRLGLPVYNPLLGDHFQSWTTRRTSQGDGNPYMWFDIDDRYLHGPQPVEIEVTYYDLGHDTWSLEYLSAQGLESAGIVQKGDTSRWLTATLAIHDGVFDNRLGGKYDFRINCRGDGDEWIHLVHVGKVAVRRLAWVEPAGPSSLPGKVAEVTAVYLDPAGWENIRYADLLVNHEDDEGSGLAVRYDVAANRLFLHDPDTGQWLGEGLDPGIAGSASHLYGRLDAGLSGVVMGTDALTLTLALSPSWRMSGQAHGLYLRSQDTLGESSGWERQGDWTINRAPAQLVPPTHNVQMALDLAQGPHWFDPAYVDLDGGQDLKALYFLIMEGAPAEGSEDIPNAVLLKYDHQEGLLYLRQQDGGVWLAGIPLGGSASLSHGLVTVRHPISRAIRPNSRTVKLAYGLEFTPAFAGRRIVYMRATDIHGADTGWQWRGWIELH